MSDRRDRCRGARRWDDGDLDLLRLLAAGATAEAVGRQLGISTRTVRRRLRALADELGVDTTVEVVVLAVRDGVI